MNDKYEKYLSEVNEIEKSLGYKKAKKIFLQKSKKELPELRDEADSYLNPTPENWGKSMLNPPSNEQIQPVAYELLKKAENYEDLKGAAELYDMIGKGNQVIPSLIKGIKRVNNDSGGNAGKKKEIIGFTKSFIKKIGKSYEKGSSD